MSAFEFFFTFYGLVLGMVVTSVATGLADVWRSQGETRIGVCTPLLGLLILLMAALSWLRIWDGRDLMAVTPAHFLVALGAGLPMAFVAVGMFPRSASDWPSLEDYYLKHAGVLLGVLVLVPMAMRFGANAVMFNARPPLIGLAWALGLAIVTVALIRWRQPWLHRVGLSLLCAEALATLVTFQPG